MSSGDELSERVFSIARVNVGVLDLVAFVEQRPTSDGDAEYYESRVLYYLAQPNSNSLVMDIKRRDARILLKMRDLGSRATSESSP